MEAVYDGIILGAGHNGMILQAYLGKAGMKVLAIDRKPVTGGGLSTLEDPRHPGFLHNTHAFFQRAITAMPWYADLELERHGARYIEPELNVALLTKDDGVLAWWTDIERTARSFEQFSRRDAETLRRWHHEFVPIVQDILGWEAKAPPLPPDERRRLLERSQAGRTPARGQRAVAARIRRSRNSSIRRFAPASCSSTACARSTCACAASAITSRPCSRARPRRRCRAAGPRRLRARSKTRCANPAANSA